MGSKVYDFSMGAGQPQRFDVRGFSFRLLMASQGPLIVRTDEGEEWEVRPGQGFHVRENAQGLIVPFNSLTIRNPSTTTASAGKIFIGDAGFDDSTVTGNVSIVDAVGDLCQYLSGIGSFAVGNTATTIIAPAANVAGLLVRAYVIQTVAGAGGAANSLLFASRVAPSTGGSQLNAMVLGSVTNNTTSRIALQQNDLRRSFPAGWGLFLFSTITVAAATDNSYGISAELQT